MALEPRSRRLEREAGRWLARLASEEVTGADHAECDAWLALSPDHRRAFEQSLERLRRVEALGARLPVHIEARRRNRRALTAGALAAGLLAAVLVAPGWLERRPHETAIGEAREVALADGSGAHLNTNTRLAPRYSATERLVRLERGEAYFDVLRDLDRPFVVETGRYRVRTVGARFLVRSDESGVFVTVLDGVVTFAAAERIGANASGGDIATVGEGERLSLKPAAFTRTALTAAQLDRATSWREGELIFEREPLADVAAELSRYTGLRFVMDADAGALPVVGMIRTDDPDGAVQALRTTLSEGFEEVTVEQRGEVVHIRRSDNAPR
ncbi:MAG TPA: FecR domain-containing protein [Vitreimonas sp.]|uniref:FecR family protein n=1 Tax=Vitreimonas sp. TaxID=3069702 RepID=UPI002D331B75|nr:FecR domain-containing protein [Vitreimonas sp.]HYD86039.1 FecR domain-containing protein [Vitreimonas sp.]